MLLTLLHYTNSKFIRRSNKGYKLLLNYIKSPVKTNQYKIILYFKNINNKFFFLKKKIFKKFLLYNIHFFLIKLGIGFCRGHGKKIKAIKKRLKKKLILNFLKSH